MVNEVDSVVADNADAANNLKQIKPAEKKTPIANFASIEDFTKNGLVEIVEATKSVNAFPTGSSRDLYCAYPSFGRVIDAESDRVLELISKVLKRQNIKGNIQRRQQDEQFEMLLECNDAMLENIGSNLDELAGIKKNPQTIVVETCISSKPAGDKAGSWNLKGNDTSPMAARLITAKNIARPQIKFKIPVDNSALSPFVPKLKNKPNSQKPLAILPEYDDEGTIISYLHPYEFELTKFTVPETQLKPKSPKIPVEVTDNNLMFVDTVPKLKSALEEIRNFTEIAIDVEHHSYRSFQGITCLVQVSTRIKDYLFDALELRDDMHILNEIFTNPKVVKILHGADCDIDWLQRDLSLYIVNMFDTHQAAKALNYARLSLSYLLKHYCDIEADKTFQLADWRIRPLPPQLVAYARQDTHFLIYIYERLTNDILDVSNGQTNVLRTIYQRSAEICKRRYVKPIVGPETHLDLFRKSKRVFDNRQLFALREIFKWRDSIARQEDESYGYVLPNHMMLQISESLPREMQGILACCNPIPPLVRQNLHILHQIILRAREQPLVKPILETDTINRVAISSTKDYNSKLYCPHDLSHCEEFRDDLPTLLDLKNSKVKIQTLECTDLPPSLLAKPAMNVFETSHKLNPEIHKRIEKIKFVSPYDRYLAVLPLVEKEKIEEAARIEEENKKKQLCPAAPTLEILDIKQETKNANPDDPDNIYSLPVKELLKRKYEESVRNKAVKNIEAPSPKRLKTVTPIDDKLKFVNLPATKKEIQAERSKGKRASIQDLTQDTDDDEPPEEMPSTSTVYKNVHQQNKGGKAFRRNKNKNKKNAGAVSNESWQQKNFDYQNVDFKKFQGGAKRAKGTELKPQFHGKGNSNKANNKKFNKLFTFSNVKGKK